MKRTTSGSLLYSKTASASEGLGRRSRTVPHSMTGGGDAMAFSGAA
jgi:hypothetical protein